MLPSQNAYPLWNTTSFPSNTLTPHSLYPGELCRSENLSSGCFFCVVILKEGNIYCAKGRTLTKAECGFSNLFLLPSRSIQFCSTYAVKGKVEICDTCSISMLSDQFWSEYADDVKVQSLPVSEVYKNGLHFHILYTQISCQLC